MTPDLPREQSSTARKAHWEGVYETKPTDAVSWYEASPTRSLALLLEAGLGAGSAVIDVGGGDSRLAGELMAHGAGHVSVADLSGAALARARTRTGDAAEHVTWIEGDITRLDLPAASYDLWHDRAVFHFLTNDSDRARYIATAARSVRVGGTVVIGTFAPDGPTRCSGLDVRRYSPDDLAAEFGPAFSLRRGFGDGHRTPGGAEQRFTWALLTRV